MEVETASRTCTDVLDGIQRAVIADQSFLETIFSGVLARGHVLLEDVPGTGKTLTAQSFATALGLSFNRIQFTPDLLPADITGTHIYNEADQCFEFQPGPVFSNVLLADEINRAPPKTQAALLEAMEERQVSVDGETHALPEPFFVIATQNPVEQEGTFVLPEAQVDRFMVKATMGYPDADEEGELIDRRADRTAQTPTVETLLDAERVQELQQVPESVDVDQKIRDYLKQVSRATRDDSRVDVGVSPRGTQRFFEVIRAWSALHGRAYAAPEDVQDVAEAALAHRLVLTPEAEMRSVSKATVIADVIDDIEVPAVATQR